MPSNEKNCSTRFQVSPALRDAIFSVIPKEIGLIQCLRCSVSCRDRLLLYRMASRIASNSAEVSLEAEATLGRANGNVYYRRPGVDNVHDGQVMVRLKKKRFVLLDYSFEPTSVEINEAAQYYPNCSIPSGAGVVKCRTCNVKIGVPVCLYDSDPSEPTSLYVRSGLCFTCQRRLNEKRRTERKRSPENRTTHTNAFDIEQKSQNPLSEPCIIYTIGPVRMKKVKHNPKFKQSAPIVEVKDDAIIINGTIDGMKRFKEGYSFQEIGTDLYKICQDISAKASKLVSTSTQITAAAAVASMGSPHKKCDSVVNNYETRINGAADLSSINRKEGDVSFEEVVSSSLRDVDEFYRCTFQSLHYAIFLLSQWKTSWDAAHTKEIKPPSFRDKLPSTLSDDGANDVHNTLDELPIPEQSLISAENGQATRRYHSDFFEVESSGRPTSDREAEPLLSQQYDEV
jgi:hypothetical protein